MFAYVLMGANIYHLPTIQDTFSKRLTCALSHEIPKSTWTSLLGLP